MKIQLISDLHLEMYKDFGRACLSRLIPAAPVLIVAGDLTQVVFLSILVDALSFLCSKWQHVIYVAGNHEYYSNAPIKVAECLDRCRTSAGRNLHIFEDAGLAEIGGKRFLCGTMWFPDDPLNAYYARYINDFIYIRKFVPWVYEQNGCFRGFLKENLREGDIVVSHHLPSEKSVAESYVASQLNRFFVSDMEDLIYKRKPSLWLHGHTHAATEYCIEKTRVVANPLGYPDERSVCSFNPALVIEV